MMSLQNAESPLFLKVSLSLYTPNNTNHTKVGISTMMETVRGQFFSLLVSMVLAVHGPVESPACVAVDDCRGQRTTHPAHLSGLTWVPLEVWAATNDHTSHLTPSQEESTIHSDGTRSTCPCFERHSQERFQPLEEPDNRMKLKLAILLFTIAGASEVSTFMFKWETFGCRYCSFYRTSSRPFVSLDRLSLSPEDPVDGIDSSASSLPPNFNPFTYQSSSSQTPSTASSSPFANPSRISLRQTRMQQITARLLDVVDDDDEVQSILVENQDFLIEPLEDGSDAVLDTDSIYTADMTREQRYQAYREAMQERISKARNPAAQKILQKLSNFVLSFA